MIKTSFHLSEIWSQPHKIGFCKFLKNKFCKLITAKAILKLNDSNVPLKGSL